MRWNESSLKKRYVLIETRSLEKDRNINKAKSFEQGEERRRKKKDVRKVPVLVVCEGLHDRQVLRPHYSVYSTHNTEALERANTEWSRRRRKNNSKKRNKTKQTKQNTTTTSPVVTHYLGHELTH